MESRQSYVKRVLAMLLSIAIVIAFTPSIAFMQNAYADSSGITVTSLTTETTDYADGQYASFNVKYDVDYGKVQKGDTLTITVPSVLKNVSIAYSKLHFSACNDLGNGQYQLVFGDSASTALTGYFSINAYATNTSTTKQTGTVSAGDKTVDISVSPAPSGGTSGTETRAIVKWGYDGTNYNQDTAVTGVYSSGAVIRFAVDVDPKLAAMANVVVKDTLPDELQFVDGSIVIKKENPDGTNSVLPQDEVAKYTKSQGKNIQFDFGDMDGTHYYRIYYQAKVVSGTNVKFSNTATINYDNGDVEESTFKLIPESGAGAAVGYKKVDKTFITDDPDDQQVTYTITFDNDNAFKAGEINLQDKLDSNVKYVTSYGSDYFDLSYDKTTNTVNITNSKEIPESTKQVVTIVTDFSNVPVGTTVSNTVGGNTVKTKKTDAVIKAQKTLSGSVLAANQFDFTATQVADAAGKALTDPKVYTAKNDASGNIEFSKITYSDTGTYYYKIAEAMPETLQAGMAYDSSTYIAKVVVSRDNDGTLSAVTTYTKADGTKLDNNTSVPKFSNSFTSVQPVTFSKKAVNGTDELPGAYLKVVKGSDASGQDVVGSWISGETAHTISGLKYGQTYTMVETTAPDGYKVAESITFSINNEGKVVIGNTVETDNTVVMRDALQPTASVTFSKKAVNGTDELTGAQLKVVKGSDASGQDVVGSWTSGETAHTISGLKYGQTYTMVETTAPDGYKVAESITFSINNEGKVVIGNTVETDNTVVMRDALQPTASVTFSKKAINGTDELPGAQLKVVKGSDASGQDVVGSWTSETTAHTISGLKYGQTYTMVETTAPDGYKVAESITFSINSEGKVVIGGNVQGLNEVVMRDAPKMGTITLTKTNTSGTLLAGAVFTLYNANGITPVQKNGQNITAMSTKEGTVSFSDVAYGNYVIKETKAPAGYDLNTTSFKANLTDKNTDVTAQSVLNLGKVVDTETPVTPTVPITPPSSGKGSITVTKSVLTQAGAVANVSGTFYVTLFRDAACTTAAGSPQAITVSKGASASTTFTNLDYGTYYVAETNAAGTKVVTVPQDTDKYSGYGVDGNGTAVLLASNSTSGNANIINRYSPAGSKTPKTPSKPSGKTPTKSTTPSSAQTGDEFNVGLWTLIALLGAAGVIAAVFFRRKEDE
ncbi:MAG: hypothetical protein LKJ83_04075 [Eubacteriaceae bacterium]|nr:hypothetical protein [Eubacteriaceae bacterium]